MISWRNYFTKKILDRGREYWKNGAAELVDNYHGVYTVEVQGSDMYYVEIWKKPNGQLGMTCTCPYAEDGSRCKHMAAACMEIDEELNGKVSKSLSTTSAKNINKRVYPFEKKNTGSDDRYVYYDLSVITENIEIMSNQLEAAKKLIEDNVISLEKVEFGYRQKYVGVIIQSGLIIAKYNKGNETVNVEIYFSNKEILFASCGIGRCRNYFGSNVYSYYANDKLCEHQVATLLLLEKYIDEYNPGDDTDYEAKRLLEHYNTINNANTIGMVRDVVEDVNIEPKLECFIDDLRLSFRIGTSKMYVLKNISAFVKNVEDRQKQKLGTKSEIDFATNRINENSRIIYEFMRKIVREEQSRKEAIGYNYYDNKEIVGDIQLFGNRLDEFFEIMHSKGTEISYIDKTDNVKGKVISFSKNTPKLKMNIQEIVIDKVFKGIEIEGKCPVILNGADNSYYIKNNKLYRIDNEATKILEPLFDMEEKGKIQFMVGRKTLGDFYYHTMPILERYIDFVEKKRENVDKYMPPKASFRFYLDSDEKGISCDAKVCYGENVYNLMGRVPTTAKKSYEQDIYAEEMALIYVNRYFQYTDEEKGLYLSNDDPEAIFDILEKGVDELLNVGEVYCTEKMKRINVQKKAPIKVGVSLESGIMNLDISSEEYSNQELLEILASYRKKKKYHRLKNGNFLNIEDENLEMLNGMLDTLHISSKDFLKGNIKVPAYRALYLDKTLEKNDSLYVERDRHFKSLIKEFKTVADSDFELPSNLQKVMRGYQTVGYRWLRTLESYSFGGILADDMGLGKTLQVISVLQAKKDECEKFTSLIISPASLVFNWQEEFGRFAPDIKTLVVSGNQGERVKLLSEYSNYDVLITSYDLLKRDIAEYENLNFDYQIIDEAQYIKNHSTAVAKAVKCINSKTKYALTGTPIENRLSELWSIFDYLMPGFLYGYDSFRKEIETPITKNKDEVAGARLKKMVSPFILRRLKHDVLKDLPDKLEEIQYACFDDKQRHIYDGQVVHMKETLANQSNEDFAKNKIQVLAELTKLRQICCDPSLLFENYDGESAKLLACIDLIRSAIEGEHRILLFSQFTSMLSILEAKLKEEGIGFYKITGSTPKEERIRLVKEFNEGDIPVFLISLKAGGTGLNLVGADVVIHYDPWWNQAVQNQATDRAHRIGQKKVVTVYKLIMKNSIEEKIIHLQDAKKNLADEILSGENGGLAQMTKEELLALL